MLLNTFSRSKRRKNCQESRWRSLTLSRVNVMLDAKIYLVPMHQLVAPATLLAPATEIRTHKATEIHTLEPLTYELFFQNISISLQNFKKPLDIFSHRK